MNKAKPDVTFVVINWNNEQYIEKCLKSIKALGGFTQEVVVVDDFSDDNSLALIKTVPDKLVLLQHRKGIANARQAGLNASSGKYLVYVDSDIEILSFDFNEIRKLFMDKWLIGVTGKYDSPQDGKYNWNNVLDIRREDILLKGNRGYRFDLKRYTTFSGGFSVYKKDKLTELSGEGVIGLAAEDLFQQIDFLNKGYYFYFTPSLRGLHHHYRSFYGLVKKCISEAKGELWLVNKLMDMKKELPIFDPVYTYPGLVALVLFTGNPYLIVLNYFPFFLLLIYRHKLDYIYLFLYQLLKDLFKIYWSVIGVFKNNLSLKNMLKFVVLGTFYSLVGKVFWLFRFVNHER